VSLSIEYHRRVRALVLFCVTGCDALFRLSPVEEPAMGDASGGDSIPGSCFRESFDGSDSDLLVNWDRGADSNGCKATVDSGNLLIGVDANISCYADIHRNVGASFVGGSASVHVVDATPVGNVETLFTLQVDPSNAYYFDVGGGSLDFLERVAGVDMQKRGISYDSVAHAHWQFLYLADPPRIAFRTSPDGEAWVERHSVTALVPLDALEVRLEAGTYNGGDSNAHAARFDDFELCLP
jgi:hypothetical protein